MPISFVKRGNKSNPWQKGGAQGAPEPTAGVEGPIVYEWVGADGKPVLDSAGQPSREVGDLIDTVPTDADEVVPWATIWRWCPANLLT